MNWATDLIKRKETSFPLCMPQPLTLPGWTTTSPRCPDNRSVAVTSNRPAVIWTRHRTSSGDDLDSVYRCVEIKCRVFVDTVSGIILPRNSYADLSTHSCHKRPHGSLIDVVCFACTKLSLQLLLSSSCPFLCPGHHSVILFDYPFSSITTSNNL